MSGGRSSPEALDLLNRKAVDNAYGLEDLDWSLVPDRKLPWAPEVISPLSHLPSYALLPDAARLRYNQLFAMGVSEQFIWLEQHILVNTLGKLLEDKKLPSALREALGHFVAEEEKHTAMFWRVLERSEPEWYPRREFRLFNVSPLQQVLLDVVLRHPRVFLVWVWAAVFFEERTVDYCRHYRWAVRDRSGGIDPLYAQLHEYHFKDEVRHYQLDQHLLSWLYDPQPRWKKRLCARMFQGLMRGLRVPEAHLAAHPRGAGGRVPRAAREGDPGAVARVADDRPLALLPRRRVQRGGGAQDLGPVRRLPGARRPVEAVPRDGQKKRRPWGRRLGAAQACRSRTGSSPGTRPR